MRSVLFANAVHNVDRIHQFLMRLEVWPTHEREEWLGMKIDEGFDDYDEDGEEII